MKIEIALNLFGKEILIPDTIVNTWIIVILLSIFAIYVNSKIKNAKADEKPSGFLNFIELLVEGVESLVKSTMGPDKMKFAPYIGTLALYLVVANLFGLLGFTPPTSDYNVTFGLALITFILTQYYGLRSKGLGGYVKGFFEPMPFLFPLNIIGELANPVSLSFRLFGNILSGVIIMGLMYAALSSLSVFAAPLITPAFHAYFDVFAGVIQTFIFVMLTMVFVSGAME